MATVRGKTALVTGPSIGRATAMALAARVLVHYRSAAEANAAVADFHKSVGHADIVKAGLAVTDGPGRLVQNAREFFDGRLLFYRIAQNRTDRIRIFARTEVEFSCKTQPDETGRPSA